MAKILDSYHISINNQLCTLDKLYNFSGFAYSIKQFKCLTNPKISLYLLTQFKILGYKYQNHIAIVNTGQLNH